MEAASQEESIIDEVVVKLVVDELPQLARYLRSRRCHDCDEMAGALGMCRKEYTTREEGAGEGQANAPTRIGRCRYEESQVAQEPQQEYFRKIMG